MARKNVIVGTDGPTNYVECSGSRYSLGVLAPVHFVVPLASSASAARQCLDAFLANGSGRLSVDEDAMFALLESSKPRAVLARLPFMPPVHYGVPPMPFSSFQSKVASFESLLKDLSDRAAKMHTDRRASTLSADFKTLVASAEALEEAADLKEEQQKEAAVYAEILEQGFDHPALKVIQASLDAVAVALDSAKTASGSSSARVLQHLVPALQSLSKTAAVVASQVEEQKQEEETQDPELGKQAGLALSHLVSAKSKIDAWHKLGHKFQVTRALLDVATTSSRVASTLGGSAPDARDRMARLLADAETIDAAFQAPR